MLFLYNLPAWLLGICIVGPVLGLSFAGYFLFHRIYRPTFTDDDKFVALTMLGVIATINSLLLAFLAISVWEAFGAAETAVAQEANTIGELGRDLAVFDSRESREARQLLRGYTEKVVNVEWREMAHGDSSAEAWTSFDHMFQSLGRLAPDTPRRVALMPEIWARTNELLKQRRSRLSTTEAAVPGTLWAVVVIGAVLTIAVAFVLMPTRFNLTMLFVLAFSTGLVFFLIIAMDRPFAGTESISPEPYDSAIENMQRWDTEFAPTSSAGGSGTPAAQLSSSVPVR
jgi:hypothetical protein